MVSIKYFGHDLQAVSARWSRDLIPSESDGELGGGRALTLNKVATPVALYRTCYSMFRGRYMIAS